MKITNLTTAVLEANFDWTFLKIETDEKITGYAEVYVGPAVTSVIRAFRPVILGQDPASFDRLVRRMRASSIHAAPGLVLHAVAGIESALLDIVGQRHGMPVWQILGGKYRDQVRIYSDCHAGGALHSITPLLIPRTPRWMLAEGTEARDGVVSVKHHGWDAAEAETQTPQSYARHAVETAAKGFRILKFDVDVPMPYETDEYNRDLSPPEIDYASELAWAVRQAVGPEIGLAIDCHWNYGVAAAVGLARALERCNLLWLEDPVPPDNIRALGEVQRHTRLPVATGENNYYRLEFDRLIREAGLRVISPDAQKMGLWEGRKIADLAEMHYVNLALHNISGPVGTMAGVHLAAAIPNLLALEWHAASVPFFEEIAQGLDGPMIVDGKIRVPEAPGLGIALNEEAAYRYRKPDEPFFE